MISLNTRTAKRNREGAYTVRTKDILVLWWKLMVDEIKSLVVREREMGFLVFCFGGSQLKKIQSQEFGDMRASGVCRRQE